MSHSCSNLVSTSFLYNPYIPFLICRNFLFTSIFKFSVKILKVLSRNNLEEYHLTLLIIKILYF